MKNRCLARCNYSIRGLSVNLPNHSKCFYSNEEVTGEKCLQLDREEPRYLPNHNTHYEVFTNGQMYSQTVLSAASHGLLQLQVSVVIDVLTKFITELTY